MVPYWSDKQSSILQVKLLEKEEISTRAREEMMKSLSILERSIKGASSRQQARNTVSNHHRELSTVKAAPSREVVIVDGCRYVTL